MGQGFVPNTQPTPPRLPNHPYYYYYYYFVIHNFLTFGRPGGGEVEFNEFYMFLALLIVCSEGDGDTIEHLADIAAATEAGESESGTALVALDDVEDQVGAWCWGGGEGGIK